MKKIFLFFFLLLLLINTHVFSQVLSGKVFAETGASAKKVSVSFLNSSNKIETNADGSFKIMAVKLPDTLVFSSPGYEPYKVVINEKNIKDPNFEVVLLSKRINYAAAYNPDLESVTADALPIKTVKKGLRPDETVETAMLKDRTPLKYESKGRASGGLTYRVSGAKTRSGSFDYETVSAFKKKLRHDSMPALQDSKLLKNQILTAGEVNDFYKWKMWGDLSEMELVYIGE